jgi:hypothetical protein
MKYFILILTLFTTALAASPQVAQNVLQSVNWDVDGVAITLDFTPHTIHTELLLFTSQPNPNEDLTSQAAIAVIFKSYGVVEVVSSKMNSFAGHFNLSEKQTVKIALIASSLNSYGFVSVGGPLAHIRLPLSEETIKFILIQSSDDISV